MTPDIKTDARQRAARTLLQSLAVTVLLAVAIAAANLLDSWTGADLVNPSSWAALGAAVALGALQSAAAWVHAHLVPALGSRE